jgi:hypothetical protein
MKAGGKTFAIRDGIEATTRAVVAADEAYLGDAIESLSWQRGGLLQRLRRVDQREGVRAPAPATSTLVLDAAS